MNTLEMILHKYGPTLSVDELAEILKIEPSTLYNKIGNGTCPVPTHRGKKVKRMAFAQDVATYLDECHAKAKKQFDQDQERMAS